MGETNKTSSVTESHGIYTVLKSDRVTKEAERDEQDGWDQLGRGWSEKAYLRRQIRKGERQW